MSRVQQPARTLVKTGFFDLDLAEAVKRVDWRFGEVRFGLGNVHKYVAYEGGRDPFLMIVSQQRDKLPTPPGYNVILTVTSYSDERNAWAAGEFEKRFGVRYTITPPEALVRKMQMYNMFFPAFIGAPEAFLGMWGVRR